MTYAVTGACIKCKFMDCVEVCPVSCFHEGENMLVINPDACIDCGVCEPECPAGAIISNVHPQAGEWVELNRAYSKKWPNIPVAKVPPADAEQWKGVENKYPEHFSEKPGNKD